MPGIFNNIDRLDAPLNTAAPFLQQCKCVLGGTKLPGMCIKALRIVCREELRLPVRMTTLRLDSDYDNRCVLEFHDANGTLAGTCRLWLASSGEDHVTTYILDAEKALSGHITMDSTLPGLLIAIARANNGSVTAAADDFVLEPRCHVAGLSGHGRMLSVNGTTTRSSVVVTPGALMHVDTVDNALEVNAVGEYAKTNVDNRICKLNVGYCTLAPGTREIQNTQLKGSYWVGGRHLLIEHSLTSNLRVVSNGNSLSIGGLANA